MARQEKEGLIRAAAAAALLFPAAAGAIDVEHIDVRYHEGRYIVEFEALLQAPVDAVEAVLTDFENYPELDTRILESKLVTGTGGPVQLATRLRGCLGIVLCRSMRRLEILQQREGELTATAIPEKSDVTYGQTRARWVAEDEITRVSYRLEIAPDFWVPPIVGRRLMIGTLRDGTLELFGNVERVARRQSGYAPP